MALDDDGFRNPNWLDPGQEPLAACIVTQSVCP